MIGALWTGISGLSSQQQALDNESNNIANVNTIGFKASRISFADQMYQDRIGKGSKILDAEKIYSQGNLRLTGVSYDMALSGEGFFTLANTSSTGTTENFYTRAGNFRMGDNGTLQDSAGNEVQGWMMTNMDPAKDVVSSNPNISVFTNDYNKLLSSKIIKHNNYIETITAKATDYNETAKSDLETIFNGAGLKTKSAKVSDIEAAIKNYAKWLQKLSEEPDGASATSTAQISHINFPSKSNNAAIAKEGDQIYVYIDGDKISQNFVTATATNQQMAELYADHPNGARTEFGLANPSGAGFSADDRAKYDLLASRIATYKGLANQISERSGLVGYLAEEKNSGGINDVLEDTDTFAPNTVSNVEMLKGIIQIKSLIPGEQFVISEVGAQSGGGTPSQGNYLTQTEAQEGQGVGALQSSRDALAKLVTGKQRDVYTPVDLKFGNSPIYSYNINIYDKELQQSIPIPNNGATPPQPVPIFINSASTNGNPSIDDIIEAINKSENASGIALSPKLTDYIEAKNINGNLVIETLDKNYDVEFTGNIKQLPSVKIDLNEIVDNSDYNINVVVNGAGAIDLGDDISTFENSNTLTSAQIYAQVQSKFKKSFIDTLPPGANQEIRLSILNGDTFMVYSTNEDTSFIGSTTSIENEKVITGTRTPSTTPSTQMQIGNITVNASGPFTGGEVFNFDILGESFSYIANAGDTQSIVRDNLKSQIDSYANIQEFITTSNSGANGIQITQNKLDLTPAIAGDYSLLINAGTNMSNPANTQNLNLQSPHTDTYTLTLANKSDSIMNLTIEGITLKIRTTQNALDPISQTDINTQLSSQLAGSDLSSRIDSIVLSGGTLTITEKLDENGYRPFSSSSISMSQLDAPGDNYETMTSTVSETSPLDKNNNFSGREGAGAEFIEIINKVDQTATKGSLQLRLDTLGISDSAFGKFSVDSSGVIMMKQDGAEFAIGQVAIALFNNNRGLEPSGDNLLAKTNDSGDPIFNLNNDKTAKVETKTLELSTADLSESLVNLMVFQRAFEANAKSITTSDQLLNTLINLKR